jgi:hypothetical protein
MVFAQSQAAQAGEPGFSQHAWLLTARDVWYVRNVSPRVAHAGELRIP